MGEFEYQLMRIPSGTHDDLADAASIVCRLLDYAPGKHKIEIEVEDPHFNWLRSNHIKKQGKRTKKKSNPFMFGQKKSTKITIPAKESWT